MKRTALTAAVLATTIALGAAACGGSGEATGTAGAPPSTTTTTTARVARPTADVDGLVVTDHGRMHVHCAGAGDTTVLLIAGWDGGDGSWDRITPTIETHARVCSYAKLGTGSSDPASTTQTFATQAADLHAMLVAAREPGPYVVLGHSFGGADAVTFASRYPEEVTGLVLLDASPTTWPATVCSVPSFTSICDLMHDPAKDAERLDVFPAFDEVGRIGSLGDLPMAVVTAAHREAPGVSADELARLDSVWADGQRTWRSLSSTSRIVTVEHTGHHIEIDQPQLVVDEVLELTPRSRRDHDAGLVTTPPPTRAPSVTGCGVRRPSWKRCSTALPTTRTRWSASRRR
jgi:pimeloyl-ACP methyl ester carboxylesterase